MIACPKCHQQSAAVLVNVQGVRHVSGFKDEKGEIVPEYTSDLIVDEETADPVRTPRMGFVLVCMADGCSHVWLELGQNVQNEEADGFLG